MIKYKVIDIGEKCPKCNKEMQRRIHSCLTQKDIKKAHLFAYWDYCLQCKRTQLYEKCRMINLTVTNGTLL